MKPFFSIIIPYHNSSSTIGALLHSIALSKNAPNLEVIVVDDGSDEKFLVPRSWLMERKKSKQTKNQEQGTRNKKPGTKNQLPGTKNHLPAMLRIAMQAGELRTIRLTANLGPGAARNRGAAVAKGKFLVFFDSDVVLFPDALHNLWKIYEEDPDIVAVTGVWVKHQKTKKFFPNFKALRDWSYWINERDKSGYYYLFSTRCASIKREVFSRLKGFDEKYAAPLVEDIEFTYRVARRYAIIFAPNVRVHHEFEDFWPIAKKYFWRSFYWTKLYQNRKKFDPVATTLQEAVTALSGVGIVGMSLVVILFLFSRSRIYDLGFMNNAQIQVILFLILTSYILILVIHTLLIRKFLAFVYHEKGLWFAIRSFFMGLVLYCFIAAGALWGRIR